MCIEPPFFKMTELPYYKDTQMNKYANDALKINEIIIYFS